MVAQANRLADVRYDIRGPVLRRARELEAEGRASSQFAPGRPGGEAIGEVLGEPHDDDLDQTPGGQ